MGQGSAKITWILGFPVFFARPSVATFEDEPALGFDLSTFPTIYKVVLLLEIFLDLNPKSGWSVASKPVFSRKERLVGSLLAQPRGGP